MSDWTRTLQFRWIDEPPARGLMSTGPRLQQMWVSKEEESTVWWDVPTVCEDEY